MRIFLGEYINDNWSDILLNDEYLREISNELRNLEAMNVQTMGTQSLKLRMDIKKFLHQMRLISWMSGVEESDSMAGSKFVK